ncbi:hypothetical protein [Spirosoma aerophilum]
MPTLLFTNAKLTNLEKDGIDVLFNYTVDDSDESQAIHVLGSQNSWGIDEQTKAEYIRLLFTGAIAYIKDHWETYEELPADKKQIDSQSDFPPYQKAQTEWEGFRLELTD